MFWLDGSSTLPFPIVSTSCLGKPCVEHLAEALASIENQAKIAKSWVEIGDFNHWCHAASELVDLTNHLVYMENSLLYYEGLISKNERIRRCSQFSSQLVDLVSFSTFERLLANFKSVPLPEPSITTLSPLHDQSVNWRPSSDSAETGAQVTTMSLALPHHLIATATTLTPPSHTPSNAPQVDTTPTDIKKACAAATALPRHWTPAVQTALAIALRDCENRSNDQFMTHMRVQQEVRVELGREGEEEKEERRREEKGEQRAEVRQEQKGRPKPPTLPPLTMECKQEPPVSPHP